MPNSYDYWLERAQNVINAESLADAQAVIEVERIILQMYAEIAKELLAFYAKYATDTGLTIQEVMKKADDFDVYAFRNKAKKYVKRKDFSDEANNALKLYNLSMKVSREKLLKQQLDLIVKDSTLDIQDEIEKKLVDAVDREVKRQAHILGEHVKIDETKVKAVVNSNFKGVNWSTRLWQDMAVVQKEVEKTTSNVLLRGRHPNEYIKDFKKQINTTTYNASRLLVTESARVQAESQKLTYLKELGEDGEYKYVAKIDKKTSKICHSLNGKIFKVKDMIPGINAPPMHPWCRSTTVPHVGNWRDKFFNERKGKYQTENKESEKEKIQEKAKKEMLDMIRSGKIKLDINPEKQNRHNKEHELFKQSVEMAKINGDKLPSFTIISNEELNKLVKVKATTGELLLLNGKFNRKEIIDFKLPIGKSFINNKYIETSKGKVHYSKTGTHVIPYIKK
ncbi:MULTISPECIES: minor capsid protein [Staphylococcus]|uniref:minor capsid protein n=1 Tax=Staphylococcus TaxID=1279 RepID=UPI00026C1572|nr:MULTISPECIES: minor capsid protein [Staphylococcus]ASJ93591.1 phage head morphogenesis protein [Staphylococcus epidermidis]EJE10417.1 phage head morphogenesis protein, SPP1 gp7 family [Staphylococcus epidermidis NIHLM023]KAB2227652.1 phage head morphogenesis protein [Staphylococcus epidermidis]MBF2136201.1 minor capsid protein [Staphylococcus epidermidis]MBF2163396.1 minor capsid protein [Staphylococcus epidermidis]